MQPQALIADLGGTHARFALVADGAVVETQVMRSTAFSGLDAIIDAYLAAVGLDRAPPVAAFCAPSPVVDDHVVMVNLNWTFSIEEIRRRYDFRWLRVINDFAAVALSIPELPTDGQVPIGRGDRVAGAAIGVLGPGTGLGVAGLLPTPGGWATLPGEGGHVTLSAADDREAAVIDHLRRRYTHVSAERVLSGMGLVNLYEAVATLDGEEPRQFDPAEVTSAACADGDRHCRLALDLFFSFLGTVAGNLALTLGARGGVYLAGGILPRLIDELERSSFRSRFEAKGRLTGYMAAIPTYAIIDPLPAMLGLKGTALAGAASA